MALNDDVHDNAALIVLAKVAYVSAGPLQLIYFWPSRHSVQFSWPSATIVEWSAPAVGLGWPLGRLETHLERVEALNVQFDLLVQRLQVAMVAAVGVGAGSGSVADGRCRDSPSRGLIFAPSGSRAEMPKCKWARRASGPREGNRKEEEEEEEGEKKPSSGWLLFCARRRWQANLWRAQFKLGQANEASPSLATKSGGHQLELSIKLEFGELSRAESGQAEPGRGAEEDHIFCLLPSPSGPTARRSRRRPPARPGIGTRFMPSARICLETLRPYGLAANRAPT